MKNPKNSLFLKTGGSVAGLVLLLIILVAANAIVRTTRTRALRVDLTEDKLYSLSEGTENILDDLERQVTLKFFFNRRTAAVPMYLKNYARQVEDLLHEYSMASDGRVVVETYDPQPDSEAEELARFYDIPGQPLGMTGPNLYMGIAAVVSGRPHETMPVLDPRSESLIEYEVTRMIYRVANPQKPVIGVMSSLPVMGTPRMPFGMPQQQAQQEPWLAFEELKQDYELREVPVSAETIDPAIDALVLVHPKELSESTQFAVDQFVLRGGRLIVLLDPVGLADSESSAAPQQFGPPQTSSDLPRLLAAWGVEYDSGQVVADLGAASRVRGADNRVEESPVWLSLIADNMNGDDVVTTQLESLMVPFAGAFADQTGEAVTFTPLITSTPSAGLINSMTARFGGNAIRREFRRAALPVHLAVRLHGKFTTAFPEGKPAEPETGDEPADEPEPDNVPPALSEGESTIVLIGDVDMVYDRFCVQAMNFFGYQAHQPINDNIAFFANAVEQLAGSTDLIGIRSRGRFNRPFERVLELQQNAMEAWKEQEATLEQKLRETQAQLREMQAGKAQQQRYILSEEQRRAIDNFEEEEQRIRKQLKNVRKKLRREIEQLGVLLKVVNIALMPLCVIVAGILFWVRRTRKKAS